MADYQNMTSAPKTGAPDGEGYIRKKIGNTVYRVSVHFSGTSGERVEDKILRLAKRDAADMKKAAGQ